jgi:hypothetical protein
MENLETIKKQITEMDTKSDEFWGLYRMVADKYHTFENPDEWQKAMMLINSWMDRSCNNFEEQIIVVAKVVEQVFLMRHNKTKSCTGTLGFTDETFFFDVYTSETEKDNLSEKLLRAHRAIEKGNVTFGGKKSKYGKKYF